MRGENKKNISSSLGRPWNSPVDGQTGFKSVNNLQSRRASFIEEMKKVESILFSMLCLMTVTNALAKTELGSNNNVSSIEMECLDLYSGIKLYVKGKQIWINVRILDIFGGNAIQGRADFEQSKEPGPIKKIGFMMMMAPFAMQLISFPGTIASIKMSLLRSIMVAKLAIIIMIYNVIVNMQSSEVVVVHQPQHHEHYYNQYHQYEEDNGDWFGR
uniref:Uncharacterized protein n=1 Tax=Vespula pensylvanica TaxID=30213 RepID=A0A834NR90_VESPE|nr:hypothetical protein H0235_011088 [Vespula pensylvanica]